MCWLQAQGNAGTPGILRLYRRKGSAQYMQCLDSKENFPYIRKPKTPYHVFTPAGNHVTRVFAEFYALWSTY